MPSGRWATHMGWFQKVKAFCLCGLTEYGHGIIDQHFIGIFYKDGIVVAGRHFAGDLRAAYDEEVVVFGLFEC